MAARHILKRTLPLLAVAVLSGCSLLAPPPASAPTAPTASTRGAPAPAPAPVLPALKPAAAALLESARAQQAAGDEARAVAELERALRIDPAHPAGWLALAELRLEQGNARQAENLARKALNLAPAGTPEARRAESLLLAAQQLPR